MPVTFPSPFPAHQGLILPVARKWPSRFDVIALSVGAAMPDMVDITLGFVTHGYFKQWYGHSLIGSVVLNIPVGLLLTWLATILAARWLKPKSTPDRAISRGWAARLGIWSFSVIVGVLSHLAFDLVSHETNLLLYPWLEHVRWLPEWWYVAWFKVTLPRMLGYSYSIGLHTISWIILSVVGTVWFYQFIFSQHGQKVLNETVKMKWEFSSVSRWKGSDIDEN